MVNAAHHEAPRRLIVSTLSVLGMACVLGLWAFESSTGILADMDRYGYPFLVALFGIGFLVMAVAPSRRGVTEGVMYVGICLYFFAALFSFAVWQTENRVYTVANTLQWMPIVYVLAFVLFRRRVAMMTAGGVYLTSLAPSVGILVWYGPSYWDATIAALLVNAYAAHLLTLVALSLVALLDQEYERVTLTARRMESAALTDGLTGVANRRGIDQFLSGLALDAGTRVGLILFDVDHFKSVNDRHGHLVGDELLIYLARRIDEKLRATDLLGRWGGEELLVVVVDAGEESTRQMADRIRLFIADSPHPVVGRTTVSAGVTLWVTGSPVNEALRLADNALYRAKALGRDRVEVL